MKTCRKCGELFECGRCAHCKREYDRAYRQRTAEKRKDSRAKYYAENAVSLRAYQARYRSEPARYQKYRAAVWGWQKRNQDARRIYGQNRRDKTRAGRLSSDIIDRLLKLQKKRCACCGKPLGRDFHLDHRVPLALGGSHDDSNMQLLRKRCNLSKQGKDPIEFMRQKGFLL